MPMPKLHYFNPGSEDPVWSGNIHLTPSANVQRMFTDLSCIPLWYASQDDLVWTEDPKAVSYSEEMHMIFPNLPQIFSTETMKKPEEYPQLEAAPWGLSPHSLYQFKLLRKKKNLPLSITTWKERYRTLTGRRMAKCVFNRLKELLPGVNMPKAPEFVCFFADVERLAHNSRYPLILKKPFSSSGRGLHWLRGPKLNDKDMKWINGALNKQGEVSVERAQNKLIDFAMEFESDGNGKVAYRGLSVFGTQDNGAYIGNVIGSEAFRQSLLLQYGSKEVLEMYKNALETALSEYYGSHYAGPLGVDMLIYAGPNNQPMVHPCVEINMRRTMGMLALNLSERYVSEDSTGNFRLEFNANEGAINQLHQEMETNYPIVMRNGRITSGYVALSPVAEETNFWAYMIISEQH